MVRYTLVILGGLSSWALASSDGSTTAGEVAGCHGTEAAPAAIAYHEQVALSCSGNYGAVAVASYSGHHHATRRETRKAKRAERRASKSSCSGRVAVAHVYVEAAPSYGCAGQ